MSGFSLVEVLISLLLLSIGISFSAQWLIQSSQLHSIASRDTQLSLLAANIAENVAVSGSVTGFKAHWDEQLKKIQKDAQLSISTQGMLTNIVIETPQPRIKSFKWVVVSG